MTKEVVMVTKTRKLAVTEENTQNQVQTGNDPDRKVWVETAAYYLAEARGFAPGNELSDWVTAEQVFSAQPGRLES
jgi:hypothetical protein